LSLARRARPTSFPRNPRRRRAPRRLHRSPRHRRSVAVIAVVRALITFHVIDRRHPIEHFRHLSRRLCRLQERDTTPPRYCARHRQLPRQRPEGARLLRNGPRRGGGNWNGLRRPKRNGVALLDFLHRDQWHFGENLCIPTTFSVALPRAFSTAHANRAVRSLDLVVALVL